MTGVHRTAAPTRVLATVLFTDIVDATGRASRLPLEGVEGTWQLFMARRP